MEVDFYALQNGSDIRGVALDGVEGEKVNLTPEVCQKIAQAFVKVLAKKTGKKSADLKISIGNDSRISADIIKESIFKAAISLGCEVLDSGLSSTPSMFMSTIFDEFLCDGAIMITASHLPFNRNGMKFFDKQGGFEKSDIKEILTLAKTETADINIKLPQIKKINLMDVYAEYLKNKIKQGVNAKNYDLPLKGLKVVVDAGNGAGGFFVDKVLNPLGAITKGSQFLNPDGNFPNHIPNPEDKKAMEFIQDAVVKNKADLGLIFDTDVDRASAVDRYGRAINKNAIVALMGAIVAKDYPVSVIVTDSVTSDKLTEFLENDLKMIHRRFKRGYKNIINEAIRLNNEGISCYLAIETSGHCALGENFFLDDGAYMTVKILIEAANLKKEGKTIDMLISQLQEAKEAQEFRLKLKCADFKEYGEKILRDFEDFCRNKEGFYVAKNSFEGVRVSFDDEDIKGWLLLRMSLHDPLMPLNIETDNYGGMAEVKKIMYDFLKDYEYIDISSLK